MATDDPTRILLVTRNLPPLIGGMERLNWHLADELSKVADVRIIGPRGAADLAPSGIVVREITGAPIARFLALALLAARREARRWRPDIVIAGSGLTAPIAYLAARACGARAVAYVHGLDVVVPSAIYRSLWWPALHRMDRLIANSRATAALCAGIGIDPAAIGVVHPGVAMPSLRDDDRAGGGFRDRHHLGDRRLLLSVGRLTDRKGLLQFVTQALPRIATGAPDVLLAVAGDAPVHALHARTQTAAQILQAASDAGVAGHVRLLGPLSELELQAAYDAADLHVFPIREIPGDPEGFGMVAIEAAARGVPTVAFASGGVVDAVAHGRSGWLIPPGAYAEFADAVCRELDTRTCTAASCIAFARGFEWSSFGRQMANELSVSAAPGGHT
jgi:phosphatidylinositol alpha-1,6-mannosyltransferase